MAADNLHPGKPSAHPPVVIWRDVFALVDQGNLRPADYPVFERMVLDLAAQYPQGVGGLIIIPASASPPTEEVREAINGVLRRTAPKVRCLCWLVEGGGFRGAAVRGVLSGLRIISRPAYPTHISNDIDDALRWILVKLSDGQARQSDIPAARRAIDLSRGAPANAATSGVRR